MPRLDSSDREVIRGIFAWGPAAFWAAVLFLLSALPNIPSASWLPWGDKVGHFALYAVFGAALFWVRLHLSRVPTHLWFLCLGVLYGLSDEWHQSFVPGRDASVADVLADSLGLFTGYLGFMLLARRITSVGRLPLGPGR